MDAAILQEYGGRKGETCLITADGQEICYTVCNRTEGRLVAAVGALFKGMIATGLGEIDEHFFLERCHVPSRVSVATGVFVVLFTTLSASAGHLIRFTVAGGLELDTVLSLVIFSIPGVIVGGQLGPWLINRFPQQALERALHYLLLLVAALTLLEAVL
ncbi:MAG: sulfite exporter TauE/SafE family protein [Anaerolineae bacterium]